MRFVGWFALLLSLGLPLWSSAQVEDKAAFPVYYQNVTQIAQFKNAYGEDVQVMTSRFDIPLTDLSQFFDKIPSDTKKSILFSYPEELVGPQLQAKPESFMKGEKTLLMPLQSAKKKSVQAYQHLKNAASNDRMGLFFVVVNTAYDSFLWVHADSYGVEQRSAMILFNTVIAVAFGLDKDMWTHMTRPLNNRIGKFFERFQATSGKAGQVTSAFLSNIAFSMAIQLARVSILSYPNLLSSLSTVHFWGTSLLLGSMMTFTGFGWSEMLADVKESENPTAKFVLRRFTEVRNIVMGYAAPSGKILQPDVYGVAPIAITLVHGAAGIWMMLKANRVVSWLEQSETLKVARKAIRQADIWLEFKREEVREAVVRSCRALLTPG